MGGRYVRRDNEFLEEENEKLKEERYTHEQVKNLISKLEAKVDTLKSVLARIAEQAAEGLK